MNHHEEPAQYVTASSAMEFLKKKKRLSYKMVAESPFDEDMTPTSVARRNERERNRVKMVNNGFATLRNHVPNGAKNKKMSKVETLRSAVEYIKQLQKMLNQNGGSSATSSATATLLANLSSEFDLQQSFDSYDDAPVSVSTSSADENTYPSHPMMDQMIYSPANSTAYPVMYSSTESMPTANYSVSSPSMASRTSPTPSMSSDITSHSASSPFHNLDNNSHQHHQQQMQHAAQYHHANSQQMIIEHHHHAMASDESELFDLVNWF